MLRRARPRLRLRAVLELRAPGRGAPRRRTSTSPGTRRWPGCAPSASAARAGQPVRGDRDARHRSRPHVGGRRAQPTAGIAVVADLRGKRVGVGAVDSPQATLIPLDYLRAQGLEPGADFAVRRFDVLGGKHGDHIGGERDAARALMARRGRRRVHDRRQPPARSRARARLPAGAHARAGADRAVRPLQLHRARRCAAASSSTASASLLLAMSYDDPRACGRCSISRA